MCGRLGFVVCLGVCVSGYGSWARGQDAWAPKAGDVVHDYATEGETGGRPMEDVEWVVAADTAGDGSQYWAIPTGAGEAVKDAAASNLTVDQIVRNQQAGGYSGNVSIQQAQPTEGGSTAGIPGAPVATPTEPAYTYPPESIATGGGVASTGAGQDTFRVEASQEVGTMAGDCSTAPWTTDCPDPCPTHPTTFMCASDPCILDPTGTTCDAGGDRCTTDDRYPGCTNDICVSDPGGSICPDPCVYGTSYSGCESSSSSTSTTAPDGDKDSAFAPGPVMPIFALVIAILLPFML